MSESKNITQVKLLLGKPVGSDDEQSELAIQIAALMLEEARSQQTRSEKKSQAQLARMINDPHGKAFTISMTDQCFRSQRASRIADQLIFILQKYGIPQFLTKDKQLAMLGFKWVGQMIPNLLVPIVKKIVRYETAKVVLPGEPAELKKHLSLRRKDGVRINLNQIGEAILGEDEAERRLQIYLSDLANPDVEYISVKISSICSQINLPAWEDTLKILSDRMRQLYRAAETNKYTKLDGTTVAKFVNLDMEDYRDLQLTVDLFCRTLDEPEFLNHSAGIALQSYLPDSYEIQKQITEWALKRVENGGSPIKIRIVKGANLAMEQVEASLHAWPQAPYLTKTEVDANFKRMVTYGCDPKNAEAVFLGIGSHNLFDIAYALLLRKQNKIEKYICFEMLEGMADHIRRVVQMLSDDVLLYCPAATEDDFQNAIAYLVRRLDENTAESNFLRHAFDLVPGSKSWMEQAELFRQSLKKIHHVKNTPNRIQNRLKRVFNTNQNKNLPFENEPDTDWSIQQNRQWGEKIIRSWSGLKYPEIPLMLGGEPIVTKSKMGTSEDPSHPGAPLYHYCLATLDDVDKALEISKKAETQWKATTVKERYTILTDVAEALRFYRADLIGAMIADTGKTLVEADTEVSEAIDFVEYYSRSLIEVNSMKNIKWGTKGTVLVTPPWNFPCAIPISGIVAALAAGNCVIFKPASEAILVGWHLVHILWEAGVSTEVLQFITCDDEIVGSQLIKDKRVNTVVLTGATDTAKLFFQLRPGLDLLAETGGKNAIIITGLSDRELAIKNLVQSAFGHAGQKCSACSLAILEAEVYDDMHFLKQLKDAVASLKVGSPWELSTRLNPLIHTANPILLRGLTSLESGEEWLLKPEQDKNNPNLWSPGIKLGVKQNSFTYQNELFGPVLGVMRAENLNEAIDLANGTRYGLTSGLQSLDEREHKLWIDRIEAGNCYINRTITGAIVQRQPFGGCKESSFGPGAKAGGPNYLMQLMVPKEVALPTYSMSRENYSETIQKITVDVEQNATVEQKQIWHASIGSYTQLWNIYFSKKHDPSLILGQDNFLSYVPHKQLLFRMQTTDSVFDVLRVIAAAVICGSPLEVSAERPLLRDVASAKWLENIPLIKVIKESEDQLIKRLENGKIKRIRLLCSPSERLSHALAKQSCSAIVAPVLAHGRLELMHYLREVSLSVDYHRYGNLGDRENEVRRPILNV